MLSTLAIAQYRSLRQLVLPLGRLNLITGANGSGKSSLYRALQLLAATAQGGIVPALAREGGIRSTLWAGPERGTRRRFGAAEKPTRAPREEEVQLRLGFGAEDFGYQIDLGHPNPEHTAFGLDPAIKGEAIWAGPVWRPASTLIERHRMAVTARDGRGGEELVHRSLPGHLGILDALADPQARPEVVVMRDRLRAWRFYDHFRSDALAPARQAQIGTRAFLLDHDGANLASAIQTIVESGEDRALASAVDDAFPGAKLQVRVHDDGRFELLVHQAGLMRPMRAAELSDGTLRHLLLAAALLSARPPELLVLNEPENSLHPQLLPALGRLIAAASARCQVVVVSHAPDLIAALGQQPGCLHHRLVKEEGETVLEGQGPLDGPAWHWLPRA